jgi:hypothetical protein
MQTAAGLPIVVPRNEPSRVEAWYPYHDVVCERSQDEMWQCLLHYALAEALVRSQVGQERIEQLVVQAEVVGLLVGSMPSTCRPGPKKPP